ncbi:MAG TPA: hypothetical protein VNX01_05860 [Bacteroidia bacterium]|jgi:hypothetical protein|nr:hypothetical protein [Bacteroidia bacterium]
MKPNKPTKTTQLNTINLLGDATHREFIELQAIYGFAQRGGSVLEKDNEQHTNRLVSDVNILTQYEKKQLIFSLPVFNN